MIEMGFFNKYIKGTTILLDIMNPLIDNYHMQKSIEHDLAFSCQEKDIDDWKAALSDRINDLILHDFHKLVAILYRFDVSEWKLRQILKKSDTPVEDTAAIEDAGKIIADLIIERQLQKVTTRKESHRDDGTIDENERW